MYLVKLGDIKIIFKSTVKKVKSVVETAQRLKEYYSVGEERFFAQPVKFNSSLCRNDMYDRIVLEQ